MMPNEKTKEHEEGQKEIDRRLKNTRALWKDLEWTLTQSKITAQIEPMLCQSSLFTK